MAMDLMSLLGFKKKDIISLAIDEAIELFEEKNYDAAIQIITEKALSRQPEHRRGLEGRSGGGGRESAADRGAPGRNAG